MNSQASQVRSSQNHTVMIRRDEGREPKGVAKKEKNEEKFETTQVDHCYYCYLIDLTVLANAIKGKMLEKIRKSERDNIRTCCMIDAKS